MSAAGPWVSVPPGDDRPPGWKTEDDLYLVEVGGLIHLAHWEPDFGWWRANYEGSISRVARVAKVNP